MLNSLAIVLALLLSGCIRCSNDTAKKTKEKLHALAYFASSPTEDTTVGVDVNLAEKTQPGVTVWIDHPIGELNLMDMGGQILRKYDLKERLAAYDPTHPDKKFFEDHTADILLAKPYQNDSFLVLYEDLGLVRMNLDGTIRWVLRYNFHHDFHIEPDGRIFAISRVERSAKAFSTELPVLDNCIIEVSPDGVTGEQFCFLELFEKVPEIRDAIVKQPEYFHYYEKDAWDALHTNSVSRATEDIVDGAGKTVVAKGDFLICCRHADMIFVIDPIGKAVRWWWGHGQIEYPHDASFAGNGRILLFDNGTRRGWSRVIEVDPKDGEIKWEYHGEPKESFLTKSRGAAQRLPNGNTMITNAKAGAIFEVTPSKELVWHFHGPVRQGEHKLLRTALYRTYRLDKMPGTN